MNKTFHINVIIAKIRECDFITLSYLVQKNQALKENKGGQSDCFLKEWSKIWYW